MYCNYRYCGKELPDGINGNRRYCSDGCNYAERLEREKEKNAARKASLSELKRIEALLRVCYNRYREVPFDINVLREMKMNWSVVSNAVSLEGIDFRVVGPFGYSAFDNNTIKIVKL